MISDIELVGSLYVFFKEMTIKSLAHFSTGLQVLLLLSCRSSLYVLKINILLDKWFANIFSHSTGCLITLLIVSFAVQKRIQIIIIRI